MPHSEKIFNLLLKEYPNPTTALNYSTPWQLLVAVILSAQCTDVLVNKVTSEFFIKYPTQKEILKTPVEQIAQDLRRINYYNTKAKNIYKTAALVEANNGVIPLTIEELIKLNGVGRKVANVVINELTEEPEGIVVDTHVTRLSQRLGFTTNKTPEKIEKDLIKTFPKSQWRVISHLLILHGRAVCKARNPLCSKCVLSKLCPSAFRFK